MNDEKSKTPASDVLAEHDCSKLPISKLPIQGIVDVAKFEQLKRIADALETISVDYCSIESSLDAIVKGR